MATHNAPPPAAAAATSPDGSTVALHAPPPPAVPGTPPSRRLAVKCYDARLGSSRLKCTLAHTTSPPSGGDDDAPPRIASLSFPSESKLAALLSDGSAIIWDLNRGVVSRTLTVPKHVVHSMTTTSSSSDTSTSSTVYLLCSKVDSGKLSAHAFDADTGRVTKKIKVGSLSSADDGGGGGVVVGLACANDGSLLAVRNGREVRLVDAKTGERVGKVKLKDGGGGREEGGPENNPSMAFSDDGKVVAARVASGWALCDVGSGKVVGKIHRAGGGTAVQVVRKGEEKGGGAYSVLLFDPAEGTMSLHNLDAAGGSKKDVLKPVSTLRTSAGDAGFAYGCFHPSKPRRSVTAVVFGKAGSVSVHVVDYRTTEGKDIEGDIFVGGRDADGEPEGAGEASAKKRSLPPKSAITLGPGEAGGEALTVSDRPTKKTRPATPYDDDEEDVDEGKEPNEDDDEGGPSIGERLRLLTAALEDDESDYEAELAIGDAAAELERTGPFRVKGATSESLTALLTQALRSGDDAMLELALGVKDRNVIERTVKDLAANDEGYHSDVDEKEEEEGRATLLSILLAQIATRMAKRPARAEILAVWVRFILSAAVSSNGGGGGDGGRMGKAELDVVSRLGPLRNMLQERVDNFPDLLKLEGRLALLGHSP